MTSTVHLRNMVPAVCAIAILASCLVPAVHAQGSEATRFAGQYLNFRQEYRPIPCNSQTR
jgi:hypothetical protein